MEKDPRNLSKYEFLQKVRHAPEVQGRAPDYLKGLTSTSDTIPADETVLVQAKTTYQEGAVHQIPVSGSIWMTRRRRDGKLLLAREFKDQYDHIGRVEETLLRLLNHPNLVCLVDIVRDGRNCVGGDLDYMVWEHCNKGTLNRLLWHLPSTTQVEIPESLCWHVLEGISQALLWLHYGHKYTFPFDRHMEHDDDWHPVLIRDISPTNIYFCAPEGDETYGDVKLGCFESAVVAPTPQDSSVAPRGNRNVKYQPPEFRKGLEAWSMAAEVWSLGAVLYHMMVGKSPIDTERDIFHVLPNGSKSSGMFVKSLPNKYSSEIREIVLRMLTTHIDERPTAADLSVSVDTGMRTWRQTHPEGRLYVGKGERRRGSSLLLGQD